MTVTFSNSICDHGASPSRAPCSTRERTTGHMKTPRQASKEGAGRHLQLLRSLYRQICHNTRDGELPSRGPSWGVPIVTCRIQKMAMSPVDIFILSRQFQNSPILPVEFTKVQILFFLMSIGVMSPVVFNERPCHPVEFKGQGSPLTAARRGSSPHPILRTTLDGFYLHGQYSQHSPRPNPPHNRQVLDPLSPPLLPTPPFPLPWLHYHKAAMGASSGGLLQPAGGRAFLQTMTLRKACSFRIYYYTPMTLF